MEIELTKGSSQATGSQADNIESVGPRHNLERTAGLVNSVAQQVGPSRPISPNVVINHPKNVIQERGEKLFRAYPKKIPRCSCWVQDSFQSNCKIRVFSRNLKSLNQLGQENYRRCCPRRRSGNKDRQRSKTGKEARVPSSTLSTESQNQTTVSQATRQVIYQPIGVSRELPKLKLTEFSGDPLEWPGWGELFDVIVHQ